MGVYENNDRIGAVHRELNPRAVSDEVHYLVSHRLKTGWATERAGKSADTPLPLADRLDKKIRQQKKQYDRAIEAGLRSLESALVIQKLLLTRLHDSSARGGVAGKPTEEAIALAEEEINPKAKTCANCKRVTDGTREDRLVHGRCRPCATYFQRHEQERPQDLWAAS